MSSQHQDLRKIQKVVSAIQNFFAIGADLSEADAATLNDRLTDEVTNANSRLKRCDELLRKGLRSEAIQEAERAPSVLELVAELDFEESEAWAAYVSEYDQPPAPALLFEVASEINEAYTQAQPLEKLLRRHRVLALARCGLVDRIDLLRTIANKDPDNTVWLEDLDSYEKARLTELDTAFQRAAKSKSLSQVGGLLRELKSDAWRTEPSAKLVEKVEKEHRSLRAQNASRQLVALEKQINDGYSEFNLAKTTKLRTQWETLIPIARLKPDHELLDLVQPAFNWLDEETEQAQLVRDKELALGALDQALDEEKTDRAELSRLMDVVTRFDEPVSERTQARFSQRMQQFETRSKRKTIITITVLLALILVVGAIIGGLIMLQLRRSEIADVNQNFQNLIENNKLPEAESFYQGIQDEKPHIANDSTFVSLKGTLEGLVSKETEQDEMLSRLLESARKNGISNPSLTGCQNAINDLEQAKEIANDELEKAEVATLMGEVVLSMEREQKIIDDAFLSKVQNVRTKFELIDQLDGKEIDVLLPEAKLLLSPIGVSRATYESSLISVIVKGIENHKTTQASRSKEENILSMIEANVGRDVNALKRSLDRYVNAFPDSSRSVAFKKFVEGNDYDTLDRIKTWNRNCDLWNRSKLSQASAKSKREFLEKIRTEFSDFPATGEALEFLPHVKSIEARIETNKQLAEIFKDVRFKLHCVVENNSTRNRHYFIDIPPDETSYVIIQACQDSINLVDIKTKRFTKKKLVALGKDRAGVDVFVAESPQMKFLNKNRGLIEGNEPFETKWCSVLSKLYMNEENIDPIFQLWLIQEVLNNAKTASPAIAAEYSDFGKKVNEQELKFINFVNPEDGQASVKRKQARLALASLEDPQDIYDKKVSPRIEKQKELISLPRINWFGIAIQVNKQWEVFLNKKVDIPSNCGVYIFGKNGFRPVGTNRNGKLNFNSGVQLSEGTLLFFFDPANEVGQ